MWDELAKRLQAACDKQSVPDIEGGLRDIDKHSQIEKMPPYVRELVIKARALLLRLRPARRMIDTFSTIMNFHSIEREFSGSKYIYEY